jgi:hypothetical protein
MVRRLDPNISFHDSRLLEFNLSPRLDALTAVLQTSSQQRVYSLHFGSVLRLEFETTGVGEYASNLSIYEVYAIDDDEHARWTERLRLLADHDSTVEIPTDYGKVHHVILASSLLRGLGDRVDLEGISIVCRSIEIEDVTWQWPGLAPFDPGQIPSGD